MKAIAVAAILAATFGAGWAVNGWRGDAKLSELRAGHAEAVAAAKGRALGYQIKLSMERDAKALELAGISADGRAKLKKETDEANRLRDCLRRGTCGLRVAAVCPAVGAADVPGAAPGGSVDTGAGAGLTPDAEQAYIDLRIALPRVSRKLAACQASVRALTGQK